MFKRMKALDWFLAACLVVMIGTCTAIVFGPVGFIAGPLYGAALLWSTGEFG